MPPPLFSIIVPTHERPTLLSRALKSLIAQTCTDFHVIVVDDSAAYIAPYPELAALRGRYTYVIRSGESGPAQSRNLALALVDAQYVMFLDDDDTLEPSHLHDLAQQLDRTNTTTSTTANATAASPALLFCDFKVQHEDRTTATPTLLSQEAISLADVTLDSVYVRNRIPNSCLLYRRDLLADLRYDTAMQIYEDWDFLLACLPRATALRHVPIHSVRIHKSSATAPANMRRGNTHDDKIAEVMLQLYKRHPAPNSATRAARQSLMASVGITLAPQDC